VISTTGLAEPAEIRPAGEGLSISMPESPDRKRLSRGLCGFVHIHETDTAPRALPVCKSGLPDFRLSGV
jgi:hypothetical protein